jgi:hypothetical protein
MRVFAGTRKSPQVTTDANLSILMPSFTCNSRQKMSQNGPNDSELFSTRLKKSCLIGYQIMLHWSLESQALAAFDLE